MNELGKVLKVEWALLFLVSVVSFVIFRYHDLDSLTIWSIYLLDVIFEGRVMDVYLLSLENPLNAPHAPISYDIFAFMPWAIWNIPIWIGHRFFDVHVPTSILSILWSKLFLVANLGITAIYARKIMLLLTKDVNRSNWVAFLSMASIFSLIGVYYAGQNDITTVMFSTIAIYFLLKKQEWKFLLFAAFAVAAKPFFMFSFIGTILLYEKRLDKIAIKIAFGASVLVLSRLVFSGAPGFPDASGVRELGWLLNVGIDTHSGLASYFVLGLLVIYYFCYMKNIDVETLKGGTFIIWVNAAIYLVMFSFGIHPWYRYVYLIPFVPILLLLNMKALKINMLVYTAVSALIILLYMARDNVNFFRTFHLDGAVIVRFFGEEFWRAPRRYVGAHFMSIDLIPTWMHPPLAAITLFGLAFLVITNYPDFKARVPLEGEGGKCGRWILWCNAFLFVPFLSGLLYALFSVV